MKSERLFDAITGIRDQLIDEAAAGVPKRQHNLRAYLRYGALAASFLLVCGLGSLSLRGCGASNGSASGGGMADNACGGAADPGMADSGSAAQDVQDAILPLTVPDHSTDGVAAERIVTLDLSAAETTGDARVTDQYILTNAAGEAVTLPLAYPVANASPDTPPTLLLDGEPVPADVSADGTLLWTSADATIPAGGSVTAVFTYDKPGLSSSGAAGRAYAYALNPAGSTLSFTSQTAALVPLDGMSIQSQNFGFDLDAGILTVPLEPDAAPYFLTVLLP